MKSRLRRALCLALLLTLCGAPQFAPAQDAAQPVNGSRELFALYGFDESYFSKLTDAAPLDDDQTESILRGLFALRRFRREDLHAWRHPGRDLPQWLADAPAHAGEVIEVRGRLKQITRVRPLAEIARRFEMPQYFRCELELSTPPVMATVFAISAPQAILPDGEDERECDVRVGFQGAFLKRQSTDSAQPAPVFLTQRLAWRPDEGNYATLSNLGFDAGLMEGVKDKTPLSQSSDLEREAFYQMLSAMNRTSPDELHAMAVSEVRSARKLWESELQSAAANEPGNAARHAELERLLDRADDDADDVTPLFNAPAETRGRLATFLGTARRAIEIRVDDRDILARFGVEKYYEIELVTPDSRGNPIAICVLEVPPGMPIGEEIYEPIRATGFFLKTWGFRTRLSNEGPEGTVRKQLAPLLIGRDLEWLKPAPAEEMPRAWIVVSVAVVAGLAIVALYWINRDRRSRIQALPDEIQLPD